MIQVPTVAGVLAAMPAEAVLRTTVQNIRDVLDVIHAHPKLDPDRDPIVDLVSTIENPDPGEPSFPIERRRTGDTPVHFAGIDPLNIGAGAVHPMIPASWRFGFYTTDHGLRFGYRDDGPLVAWDAVTDALEKSTFWFTSLAKCARLLGLADDVPIPSGVVAAVERVADAGPILTPDHVAGLRHALRFMEEYPVGWPGREELDQHAKDAVAIIEKYVAAKGGA